MKSIPCLPSSLRGHAALLVFTGCFLLAVVARGATITVTTTADVVDGNVTSVAALQATPGGAGISLREAVRAVNNDPGGPHTISIPAGTYTLSLAGLDDTAVAGDLDVLKAVTITGAGSAATIIQAGTNTTNGVDKIFSFNPLGNRAGFPVTMSGVTLRFGRNVDPSVAGGNNVGGGMDFDAGFGANFNGLGNLTLTDVVIDQCATTNGDGGGLAFFDGGTMTLTNCQFTNNRAVSNSTTTVLGGGIEVGFPSGHASNYTFNNCTISGNSTAGTTPSDGGGFYSFAGGMTFHGCTISNNTANGASSDGGGIHAIAPLTIDQGTIITGNSASRWGGGVHASGTTGIAISNTTITGNTGSANGTTAGVGGGGIFVGGINGTATVGNCRIASNVSPIGGSQLGCQNADGATMNASNNWFGTNAPPASFFGAGVTANPFLVLTVSAAPTTINTGQTSTVTASITRNSSAQTGFTVPAATPVTFAGVLGTLSPASSTLTSGVRASTFTAGGTGGGGSASATVDSQTVSASIAISQPPAFTSANGATFVVGTAGNFTVSASGSPTPVLNVSGALPGGVTFTPGTGALSGTPAAGSGGSYPLTFTATNTAGSVPQSFTLTVNQAPAITSANTTTFTEGTAGTFTVTRTGFPAPTLSLSGTPPAGVTFTAATGVLSGTPGAGTGANYALAFTAGNGVGSNAAQNFTLKIEGPPVVANVGPLSVNEDSVLPFTAANFSGSYSDPNGDPIASVIVTSLPANGVLKNGATTLTTTPVVIAIANIGNLTFVPNGNFNGASSFTWNASDGALTAVAVATVNLTVNAVNDAPSFVKGADQTVLEDAAAQSVAGWATALSAGPANEAGQVLNFIVSNNNNALFSAQPAVAANGTLTFTPAANANGSATVTVQLHDNGGTANGGVDTSAAQIFTITVTAVNDAPSITAQAPIALAQNHARTIVFTDLTVSDADNPYPAGFTLSVQNGANYARAGNTITPTPGFVGTLSVPVLVNDGAANSNVFNLAVTVNPNAEQVATNATIAPEPGGGFRVSFLGAPGASYTIQFTNSLAPVNWQTLGTVAAAANGRYSLVDLPPANTPMRYYRSTEPYLNDFGNGPGPVTLRGTAVLTNSAIMLTDNLGGQLGAAVFEGLAAGPALNGFTARFNLTTGPTTTPPTPGDGVSFAVGDLGAVAWGESGPGTASSLAVGFDTYENGGAGSIGIHLWVNSVHLAANSTNPFSNGAAVPVEISYGTASGLTVRFNSVLIFTNLSTPGFAFPVGGKFGIGARTGGAVERAVVDDVEITPR